MSKLIEAIDLEIAYGDVAACQNISFFVEEGEIVTFVGSNGAGKSTTMRAVAGAICGSDGGHAPGAGLDQS
jgi:branched-chain amino acid transport system ATP-binding protein